MRVLIDLTHPADAHQFRHLIRRLGERGHHVLVTARDKDVTQELLKAWRIPYMPRKGYEGLLRKAAGLLIIGAFLLSHIRRFKPDILLGGTGNCYIAQAGWLSRTPSVIYDDTEHSTLQNRLTFPFAAHIVTPACYTLKVPRQVRIKTYKELFYLHPAVFTPDPGILGALGIGPGQPYFIVRFVAWGASHDVGAKGLQSPADKRRLIASLEPRGRVFISSEAPLPRDLERLRLRLPFSRIHDALAFATLVVSEGATVAAEAAVLGVPAVYANSLPLGYLAELEQKYGLAFQRPTLEAALPAVQSLLDTPNLREEFQARRKRMLEERIDGTQWLLEFLEKAVNRQKGRAQKPVKRPTHSRIP